MRKVKLYKLLVLFICLGIIALLMSNLAVAQYKNQEKIPGYDQTDSFMEYMEQIIGFSYAVIGILAMFMLMIGAYQYLMAAGNLAKVDSAKQIIASALLGLGLGLISFLILNTINPDLVSLKGINLEGLNVKLEKLGGGSSSSGVSSNAVSGSVPPANLSSVKCETVRNYDGFMNKNFSDSLYNEKINSAEDLKTALVNFRSNNNGLIQYADLIYQECKDKHVPFWYAIGTFAHESNLFYEKKTNGELYGCSASNNPGCIHDPKTDKPKQYPNAIAGIKDNIATMGRRINENPTPLGAWAVWYWPDRPGNCAGAQSYLSKFDTAAKATGLL